MDELIFDVAPDEDGRLLAVFGGESIFTDGADWEDLKRNAQEVVEAFIYDRPKSSVVGPPILRYL